MIRPWKLIASQPLLDTGLFQVTHDRALSPRTGGACDFHLIHMADWLMVVSLTREGRLLLVRQYRHGSREAGLEVPGGLHDRDGEGPEQGAVREVAEETGYGNDGEPLVFLGELRPQPALLSNRVWIYVARGLRPLARPELDPGEDIEVVLIEPHEIPARIASGEINNAMTVAALSLAHLGGHLGEPRRSPGKENGS